MLFCVALDCLVATVAMDWKVETEPVYNKLSCIFAIVSAGVVAPDMSSSSLVSGNIRLVECKDVGHFLIHFCHYT